MSRLWRIRSKPRYDCPQPTACATIIARGVRWFLASVSRCPALTRTPRVSVVDDDESVRVAIGALVRSLGRVACTFASAEDFLNSPEAEATDCLVADIQMPGMTGIELQQTLATRGSRVPIVFITSFPECRIREHVLAAGAICLLSKPCDTDALVNFIETALLSRSQDRV